VASRAQTPARRKAFKRSAWSALCLGGRIIGPMIAWGLVTTFLAADFSQEERHLRHLSKVAALENTTTSDMGDKAAVVPA
jgi:ribose 5-phosphate isomerase RpiB